MVVQLHGNLFFGNAVEMTDTIKKALAKDKPVVVVIDFTLVVNMDSSAAHAVNKLKSTMHQLFQVDTNIFVMGNHRGYFPCEYALSRALLEDHSNASSEESEVLKHIHKNHVCVDFDEALVFAEDILIAREDPSLLKNKNDLIHLLQSNDKKLTIEEEKQLAAHFLQNLVPHDHSANEKSSDSAEIQRVQDDVAVFLSYFEREVYCENQVVWKQGSESDSAKLVVSGNLVASMDGTDVSEEIPRSCVIGELGLVDGMKRLSNVICESDCAVVFSMNRDAWERLIQNNPSVARILDHIVIRYLSHRVQHVSNRIFETRCLPI